MGLYAALYAGVSGLDSQSNAITATSNNISNVNTIGYKQQVGQFSTLVAGNASGGVLGTTAQLINQQGIIQSTSSPTDVAISGNGFLVVNTKADGTGQSLLTRAGSFTQDALGNFVNSDGYYLQGLPVTNGVASTNLNATSLKTVQVSQSASGSATPTNLITLGANLDATQSVLLGSGETATLAGDSTNANNTAADLIIPTGTNGIQPGDTMNIVSAGNTTTPDVFTYGGITEGRDITSSAVSSDGNGGGNTLSAVSIQAGSISAGSAANEITINVPDTSIYTAGQNVTLSGATTGIGNLTAANLTGQALVVSTSSGTGPGTITLKLSSSADTTGLPETSGAFISGASSFNVGGYTFNVVASGATGAVNTGSTTTVNVNNGTVQDVLSQIATFLNQPSVNQNLPTPLQNQTFGSNATTLYVENTTTSTIAGNFSTSFNNGIPTGATTVSGIALSATADAQTTLLTMTGATATSFIPDASSFNIGGVTMNVVSSGGGNGSTGPNLTAGNNTTVLGEMVTYLNSTAGQAALAGGPLAGIKFGSTGTTLYAISNGTAVPNISTSFSASAPAGAVPVTSATSIPAGSQDVATFSSTSFTPGTTITVGSTTMTLVAAGTANPIAGEVLMGAGSPPSLTGTLSNVAAYLNANGNFTGITYTSDATHLIATNTGATTLTGAAIPQITVASNAPLGSSTIGANTSVNAQTTQLLDVSGSFANNDTITVGGVAFTLTNGAGGNGTTTTINISGGTGSVLQQVAEYLNSQAGQTALGKDVTFSVSGTTLSATNPTATATSTFTASVTSSTATATPFSASIVADNGTLLTTTGGANSLTFSDGSVFNIGGQSITLGASGSVALGSTDKATLQNLAARLNTISSASGFSGGSGLNGLTFSTDGTSLYVSNSGSASITPGNVNFTAGTPSGTTLNTASTIDSSLTPLLTVPNSGPALTIEDRTYAFTGNILNATTPSGDFMGATASASDFTTAALNFKIAVAGVGTYTFTYNSSPNTSSGQFDSLNTLAQAINSASGNALTASVSNNRLYVGATNANNPVTFTNGDATGDLATGLSGINWVQELGLPADQIANVNAGVDSATATTTHYFNSMASLASQISKATNLTATITNATVSINEANPEQTISFSDGSNNAGSLLSLFGFKGQGGSLLTPLSSTSPVTGQKLYTTETLPITYNPTSATQNMSGGGVTPQYTKDITIYDSLGNSHTVAFNAVKLGINTWAVELTAVPASDVVSANGDGQIANGIVTFKGDGSIEGVKGTGTDNLAQQPININWNPLTVGALPSSLTVNLDPVTTGDNSSPGLTQSAGAYDAVVTNANGSPVGQLTGVSINSDGFVVESFSNGQTFQAYQIPLANVNNPNGLESVSGDAYSTTITSGVSNLNLPGTNGVGSFSTESLEQSNVDLSTQLTALIVAQQAYGANSKVLTVADQLLQELDQIIQ